MWRHTRRGDRYVTVIIDLTPVRDRSGPARLLDLTPGRSKKVLKTWLSQRDQDWRGRVEVVATGRFHRVPRAPPTRSSHRPGRSWTPTRVVSLAGDKLDECRRRLQQAITGRRGRAEDPLYRARRTLRTGTGLLTDTQAKRLEALFTDQRHAPVQAAWGVYQRPVPGLPHRRPGPGKVPDATAHQLPDAGRSRRAGGDPDTSQGPDQPQPGHPGVLRPPPVPPTPPRQAINGRLEHLRGITLGFRNLAHYTICSLFHTGRLKDHLTATT